VKIAGCPHRNGGSRTDLKPLRPMEQGFGFKRHDSEHKAGHDTGELWERIVSGSTHSLKT
jgi:hypothetical protein